MPTLSTYPNLLNMTQFVKYVRATMAEMRQVAWPTKREATMYTILIIVISAVVALYVGAFDYLFSQGINFLINRF
jgi:preprotein translocase subunit SecE